MSQGDSRSRFDAKLREVEEDLARLRGARESMAAVGTRAREVATELADETVDHTSDDGVATVSCDGRGKVSMVVFDSAGYNRTDEQQLCVSVLQARQHARDLARCESAALGRDTALGGADRPTGV